MSGTDAGFDVLLGNTALDRHLISREQLDTVARGDRPLAEILVERGFLTLDQRDQLLDLFETPLPPNAVPRYHLHSAAGKGAMGTVYRGTQESTGRTVAVKILSPALARDKSMTRRFLREFETMKRLDHPSVVKCIEAGEAAGTFFIVLEFVEGQTLLERIKTSGALPEPEALDLLEAMTGALEHAHSLGMIHRDVKPANILMGPPPKLADFGLARDLLAPAMTGSLGFLGTPYYCSPEQAEGGGQVDIRGDFYSLGATFYHAVTGMVPFEGDSAVAIVVKHVGREARPPRERGAKISAPFEALIGKLMMKDPLHRPQDPAELRADLASVRAGRNPSRLHRRRWPSIAATALILLLAAAFARALTPHPPIPWAHGAVEKLPDGRCRITYEFISPDDALDWRPARAGDAIPVENGALVPGPHSGFWQAERWDGDVEVEIVVTDIREARLLLSVNPGETPDLRAVFGGGDTPSFRMQLAGNARQFVNKPLPEFKAGSTAVIRFTRRGKTLDFFYNDRRLEVDRIPERLPVSNRLYFGVEGSGVIADGPGEPRRPAARIDRVTITGTRLERPTP